MDYLWGLITQASEKRGGGGSREEEEDRGVLCAAGAQPVLVLRDCCGWQYRLGQCGQQDVYLSMPINSPGLPSTQCQGYVSVLGKTAEKTWLWECYIQIQERQALSVSAFTVGH